MANISFGNLDQQFSFVLEHYTVYKGGTLEAFNSVAWSWVTKLGHDVEFSGTDLQFNAGDLPFAGTLTQLVLDLNNDELGPELAITDLSVAATDLGSLVNGGLTNEQQENLFWRVLLAGDDEIDFTAYARNDPIDFAADGRHVESGQTLFGGDDAIAGNIGTDAVVSGDYYNVNAGATAYGGGDVMNGAGTLFLGDFNAVSGFASGGDDTITVEADKSFNTLSGDAHTVAAGGILAGGDDTINAFGTSPGTVLGDAPFVHGQLVGGNDTITSGDKGETLMGDADKVEATGILRGGHDVIKGGGGSDVIFGDWRHLIPGGKAVGGNDQLFGEAGDDTLNGNGGNDRLEGGADLDKHFGGDGNDSLVINTLADFVAGEVYDGGNGKDTLLLGISGNYVLDLAFAADLIGLEALTFSDPGANKTATVQLSAGQIASPLLSSKATITGNEFADVTDKLSIVFDTADLDLDLSKLTMVNFLSNNDAVVVTANAEQNTIIGTSVRDIIDGGSNADKMTGGTGDDTYVMDSALDTVIELDGEGTDEVQVAFKGHTLGDFIENGTLLAAAGAAGLTGNALDNVLTGNASANTLDGAGGKDTLAGLGGSDTYIVGSTGVTIVENAGEGTNDKVRSTVNFTLAADDNIEQLSAFDAASNAPLDLTGNGLSQRITGSAGANKLGDGGGAGKDTLIGLGGDDTYFVRNRGTTIVETFGQGLSDEVRASLSFKLGVDVGIEKLSTTNAGGKSAINLTGNALTQTITGNAGANTLDDGGGGSSDTLVGLGGNDTYFVRNGGTTIVETSGGGTLDHVRTAVGFVLAADDNIEQLSAINAAAKAAIDLTGNARAQTITGNAGVNRLDGQGGTDILTGLGGKDTFVFSTAPGAGNIDRITDFNLADDTIELDSAIFVGLPAGVLAPGAFKRLGAADADDRILYNQATGALYYDQDGSGNAFARVQFAVIDTKVALTAADFVVV